MSGLEIIGAVTGIISAFTASATLYRQWRKKRVLRLVNLQNGSLERSLVIGETTVRREYETHFARLGPRFAVGDDRARAELAQYVIRLQHVIITLMAESTNNGLIVLPSLPMMLSSSEDTRTGVVAALGEQYQRFMQSAPLALAGFWAPHRQQRALEPREVVSVQQSRPIDEISPAPSTSNCCPGPLMWDSLGSWLCRHCLFRAEDPGVDHTLTIETTDEDTLGIAVKALWNWHVKCDRVGRGEYSYNCQICTPRVHSSTLKELTDHISNRHTTDDVLRVLGDHTKFLYLESLGDDKEPISSSREFYGPTSTVN